jgi:hypothetical protein
MTAPFRSGATILEENAIATSEGEKTTDKIYTSLWEIPP